jgi:uncharacterized damage-inducible protein DinB
MADVSRAFLTKSRSLLVDEYLPKIESCLVCLTDEDVWWRANDASNSIGNLLLHLRGNVTQWIIEGVGGRKRPRNRQQEFEERARISAGELLAGLKSAVEEADEILGSLDPETLLTGHGIQGYDVTMLEAIYHVVEHFGMHTGQIILLTKARTGQDLRLWQPAREPGPGKV